MRVCSDGKIKVYHGVILVVETYVENVQKNDCQNLNFVGWLGGQSSLGEDMIL